MPRYGLFEETDQTTAISGPDDMKKKKMGPNVQENKVEEQLMEGVKEQMKLEKEGDVFVEEASETTVTAAISGSDVTKKKKKKKKKKKNKTGPNAQQDKVEELEKKQDVVVVEGASENMGMKPVTNVNKVTIEISDSEPIVIWKPDVFKRSNSESYTIFGEAKTQAVEDDKVVEETGVKENDITFVMTQLGMSRTKAIMALKANNGDLVSTLVELMTTEV